MNGNKTLNYVQQIEDIELELTRLNASRSLVRVKRQLEISRIGNSILLRDRTDPASHYYNRVKGFGLQDLPQLDKLLNYYKDGSPCFDMTPNHMTEKVYIFPAFRGRGCQTALLRHRLSDAVKLGVKNLYTDVEFGSVSHGNMEKAGFKTAYLSTFWVKNS